MKEPYSYVLDYADAEFSGPSFNGDSLLATLRSLTPALAASKSTYEGYSAWSVAVHVAWFKYFIGRSLGGLEAVGDFPYAHDEEGFGEDRPVDAAAWNGLIAYLERIHGLTAALIRKLDAARAAETMPEWQIPYGRAVAWYLGHDSYHIAQIRNMGLPKA